MTAKDDVGNEGIGSEILKIRADKRRGRKRLTGNF
jgi:hypothetical protein